MDRMSNKADVDIDLTSWIKDKLSPGSLNYGKNCICKVPRKDVEAEYVPGVVSIGFLHHGKSQHEDMQEHKLKYLHRFLDTFQVTIEQLVEYIRSHETLVCECYEDTIVRDASERCKVILLDGVFIIQLFLKNHFPGMREEGDILFTEEWVSYSVLHDLMLFENQLPLRFLRALYAEFVPSQFTGSANGAINSAPPFDELVFEYFKNVGSTEKLSLIPQLFGARHFVDFLGILHMPDEKSIPRFRQKSVKRVDLGTFPTAMDLKAAGVKFVQGTNVWFDVDKRELTMPQLNLNHFSATLLRNLIAFEQSECRYKHKTSHVMLLSLLIKTERDVKLLTKHGIIRAEHWSTGQLLGFFKSLYQEFEADPDVFYFVDPVFNQLGAYERDFFSWRVSEFSRYVQYIERNYFGTPTAFVTAFLTILGIYIGIIQTVFSVLQYVKQ